MHIGIRLSQTCECQIRQSLKLTSPDGMSGDSVLVLTQKLLLSHTDYQKALSWAIGKRKMAKYRSVLDSFLVSAFPEQYRPCVAFYREESGPLREIATPEEIHNYDVVLCRVLAMLLVIWSSETMKPKLGGGKVLDLDYMRRCLQSEC